MSLISFSLAVIFIIKRWKRIKMTNILQYSQIIVIVTRTNNRITASAPRLLSQRKAIVATM